MKIEFLQIVKVISVLGSRTFVQYQRNRGAWKEQAIGTNFDLKVHSYKKNFLTSDWNFSHDAIQAHSFFT
ncbi:hypothetical protein [Desulfosediminicola ganghwensis]|uniref:hypothetical protein n=1 Tax=Desulfosediminicola ganghwensis TaxID=2569540 RepID=UPI0015946D06|nr:hypothetical protein [Desulfosediminicola ganghwensis]